MLRTYFSCLLVAAFSLSAMAADGDPKQKVEAVASEYAASFNKQDGAGIAALFAVGGIHVNPAGPRSDIAGSIRAPSRPASTMKRSRSSKPGPWARTWHSLSAGIVSPEKAKAARLSR